VIISINKPVGPTSFDIVARVRKITGVKKVGHAGTLDPLASGVLVLAIGRDDTKRINSIVEKEKEYIAEIKLGETSSTDDDEGEKTFISDKVSTLEEVSSILNKFIGEISQVPPQFSAIKIKGKRAYKSARAGEKVEMIARIVLIKEIELLEYDYPLIKIRVVTGPGVYIRSLARDIGQELGTGAYMLGLIRTRVGEYAIDHALTLEEFSSCYSSEGGNPGEIKIISN